MVESDSTAVYVRRSTADQEEQHQRDDVNQWLDQHGLSIGEVALYADQASGTSAERDEFQRLVDDIETGQFEDVVVWEISRIARTGFLAQKFFDTCEDQDLTIHVTNGSVRRIEPDGHGRMVADVIAAVAAEERRSLVRRTKSGIQRAREEGKWIGQVPAGFVRVAGYLRPNPSPDYGAGEVGFHDVANALEILDDGGSYRRVASETPNITRQTLMRIDKDEQRRSWYLAQEAADERVNSALEHA